MEIKNSTVEQAIIHIANTTGYDFVYRVEDMPASPRRDYDFNSLTIVQAMDRVLTGTNLTWSNRDNIVTISRSTQQQPASQPQKQSGKTTVSVRGQVVSVQDGKSKPAAYAFIALPDLGLAAITDVNGYFEFSRIVPGEYKIEISSLGYNKLETTVDMTRERTDLKFELTQASFRVEGVVVTAQAGGGVTTSSVITKTALEHFQVNSLDDVMQMLPGEGVTTPTLRYATDWSIRGASSLGTNVIYDGVQMNNNANLNYTSTSMNGISPQPTSNSYLRASNPLKSVDFRAISMDNVASVEVMTGITSVQYGDLGTGQILITSMKGRSPLTASFITNPYTTNLSLNHGVLLGEKGGALNYGASYAIDKVKPSRKDDKYSRYTGSLAYTNIFGKLYSTTSMKYTYSDNDQRPHMEDSENDVTKLREKTHEFMVSTEGTLDFNAGWFKNLKYTAALRHNDRKTYLYERATNSQRPYSQSDENGTVLGSRPGMHVYDVDGNEITAYPESMEGQIGWNLPDSYFYDYNIYGKEWSTSAKVIANFAGRLGKTTHKFIVGAEFKSDGNTGKGRVFDPLNPPQVLGYFFNASYRDRPFSDIPFVNVISAFAEENFTLELGRRNLSIVGGVRYDKIFKHMDGITPRVNAFFDVVPNRVRIRGGYGISYKMPTVAMLYSDDAFFDFMLFDGIGQAPVGTPQSQQFQLVRTLSFNTQNPDLEMARNEKIEIGLDAKIGNRIKLNITGYQEYSNNGLGFDKTLNSIKAVSRQYYSVSDAGYPTDPNELPVLKLTTDDTRLVEFTQAVNNAAYKTTGIEFVMDFGQIDAILTSIVLDGKYEKTTAWTEGAVFWSRNNSTGNNHIGVWDGKKQMQTTKDRFATNLRLIHRIPDIGLVISLDTYVIWTTRTKLKWDANYWGVPDYYISKVDGTLNPFDASMFPADPQTTNEFTGIDRRGQSYMTDMAYPPRRFPPVMAMNLNLTKEIGNFMQISFYANNLFNAKSVVRTRQITGERVSRTAGTLSFGIQLALKIAANN